MADLSGLMTSKNLMQAKNEDLFADVNNYGRSMKGDVFEAYITDSPTDCGDPIIHWSAKLDKQDMKSKKKVVMLIGALTRMALDFLSAPGMSLHVYGMDC